MRYVEEHEDLTTAARLELVRCPLRPYLYDLTFCVPSS